MVGAHPRAEAARPARPALGQVRRARGAAARGGDVVTAAAGAGGGLTEAAARADALAKRGGGERELAALRARWDDEIEGAARSADFRDRAVAYRAIGQFRFRQKVELLRRGLEDESPACRGAALLSLELLSRDHPGDVNALRAMLHRLADGDANQAVRRLAVLCLRNGSFSADTATLLLGIAGDDEADAQLRAAAKQVALTLKRKAGPR